MKKKKDINTPRNFIAIALSKRMISGAAGSHSKSNKAKRKKMKNKLYAEILKEIFE